MVPQIPAVPSLPTLLFFMGLPVMLLWVVPWWLVAVGHPVFGTGCPSKGWTNIQTTEVAAHY